MAKAEDRELFDEELVLLIMAVATLIMAVGVGYVVVFRWDLLEIEDLDEARQRTSLSASSAKSARRSKRRRTSKDSAPSSASRKTSRGTAGGTTTTRSRRSRRLPATRPSR